MEERKTLLAYIGPGPWLALACVLLLAAALLCAFYTPPVVEFVPVYPPPIPADAPAFSDSETEDELCSLSVLKVSDAIYQSDDGRLYYATEDEETRLYRVVSVSGETYALMSAQRAYWNDPNSPSEAIRLTGRRMPITDEIKQTFLQVFNMDEGAFDDYFGRFCLIEEPVVAPDNSRSAVWTVLAVVFALGFLALAALWVARFLPAWSAIVSLEDNYCLFDAAAQLGASETRAERNDTLRLAKGYLFGWRVGLAAAWEDVVWSYERSIAVGSAVLARVLVICTSDGRAHPLFFGAKEAKELRRLANHLCERNPRMRWDDTEENRAAWQAGK